MERLSYLLDTNVVADVLNGDGIVQTRLYEAKRGGAIIYLAQPVHYEVMRGLLKANATRKQQVFEGEIVPLLDWLPLTDADWRTAALLWAEARNAGKQLSDVDVLLAAVTQRLEGTLVSADDDFAALDVAHENWRETTA